MDAQHFAAVGDGGYVPRHILERGGVAMVTYGDDSNLKVTFEKAPILIEVKSKKRAPYFEERMFIRIKALADETNEIFRLWLDDDDPYWDRFQAQWRAYLNDEVYEQTGTQLKDAPFLNTAQVAMLEAQNIYTAEQLMNVPDSQIGILGMGAYQLKETARKYVDVMRTVRPLQEVKQLRDELRDELDELRAEVRGEEFEPSTPQAKRKRRTKAEMEAAKAIKSAIDQVHAAKETIEEVG